MFIHIISHIAYHIAEEIFFQNPTLTLWTRRNGGSRYPTMRGISLTENQRKGKNDTWFTYWYCIYIYTYIYSPVRSRSSTRNIPLLGLGLPWNQSLQNLHPTHMINLCLFFKIMYCNLPEHHHFQLSFRLIVKNPPWNWQSGATIAMARANHFHWWTTFRSSSPPCRIPSDHGTGDCVDVSTGEDVYVRWRWHGYSHGIAEFIWRDDGFSGGDSRGGIASSSYLDE